MAERGRFANPTMGSELLLHCSNASVLVPLYFHGQSVWHALMDAPVSLARLSESLGMRNGPLNVLLRIARIVFDCAVSPGTDGSPLFHLRDANALPVIDGVVWEYWQLNLLQ